MGGDRTVGFASAQVRFGGGGGADAGSMKVEVLEPNEVEHNDFLRRFLDRSGPGPHHLTFKVQDIGQAIATVQDRGFAPVGINLDNPDWMEAFLHPKEACGIVVQLAQSPGDWDDPGPSPLPPPRVAPPADLLRVNLLVADLAGAVALFQDLLGGQRSTDAEEAAGDDLRRPASGGRAELHWPGGGCIRLSQPAPGSQGSAWLGDLAGRLDSLSFRVEDPAGVAGAVALDDGRFEVPPEANYGVRLLLAAPRQ